MADDVVLKWQMDGEVFSGYPFVYTKEFIASSASAHWAVDAGIFDGYPFCYYRTLTPPYHPPLFAAISLSRSAGYSGLDTGLTVTATGLKYIQSGDTMIFEVLDASNVCLFSDHAPLTQDGEIESVVYAFPAVFIQWLDTGLYTVKVGIHRIDEETVPSRSADYPVYPLPGLTLHSILPDTVQKPVGVDNNELTVTYEVTGAGIEQINNTFTVAGHTAGETAKSTESLVVESNSQTGAIYDATINFTVTDASFRLVSFTFRFGLYNASTEVDYRLDGVSVQKGTYPMGGWVAYVAPSPVALSPGAHSIRLYNSPSYWYLYSTTTKPVVPGLTLTSSTLYAMEMVYTLSTSGVGGERSIKLTLDDTVEPGVYPASVASAALLAGYGEYLFTTVVADKLEILERAAPEPEIGGVALSHAGRYAGYEVDITATISGLENILAGDALTIRLMNNDDVLYEHNDTLEQDASAYTHTIPASAFSGLTVGAYTIRASVARDDFSADAVTTYTVVATPDVSFTSISPDSIQLPITTPLVITAALKVTGEHVSRIQGTVSLADTSFSANVDTVNLTFTAVFSNVTALTAGLYSLDTALTVTGGDYGSVNVNPRFEDVLTVLEALPEPEIGGISITPTGRYVGSETAVEVTLSGLQHIQAGDLLVIRISQDSAVFYEYLDSFLYVQSDYTHTIPKTELTGLDAGEYSVKAYIKSGGVYSEVVSCTYTAVTKPVAGWVGITPDKIQLPIQSPQNLEIALKIIGEAVTGITGITGSIALDETTYTAPVNTTSTAFSVTITGIQSLAVRGYTVTAALTVVNSVYGTTVVHAVFDNVLRVLDIPPAPMKLNSGNLYLYDGFTLVAIVKQYISFKWVRRYNKPGEFLLQLENTPENIRLIRSANTIAKDNDDEAGLIEDVTITDTIEVKGLFISKVLGHRIANYISEFPVDLKETANTLVREHFINTTPERVIPGFGIADYSIDAQYVSVRIEHGSLLQWLENLDIGFKVRFMPGDNAYTFLLYDGRHSDAVFCGNYRNIGDQRYYAQTTNVKNVCYVEREDTVTEVGHATGLDRREAYARAGKYDVNEYGMAFLKQNKPVESLDVKIINPYAPFEYKKDYDVGDIVKIVSEDYGVAIEQNILEVTEFWDNTGFHLYIVFGDIPRDLLTELQDKEERLEELENAPDPLSEEALRGLLDLVIPDIVDEVYEMLEFGDLPTDEELTAKITDIAGNIINERLSESGGKHIILDHFPSKAEYDTYTVNDVVVIYNPTNPYIPPS